MMMMIKKKVVQQYTKTYSFTMTTTTSQAIQQYCNPIHSDMKSELKAYSLIATPIIIKNTISKVK
jgi:hypothetical protein